jgi:hypothetical protein
MSRPRKDMYLVPCRTQKWQTPKVWWGEYAECKCNLSIQKHKSEIGQQSYCWKNLIKSSSFQRLKSVWTCRPKQSLQREGEWEFFLQTPNKDHFKYLFVCLFFSCFFFLWGFFGIQNLNYYSPANSSAACCIDCRARSTDQSSIPLHESNSASKRWFQQCW